jgi:adenine/guanine phosphoribosyltransferase-like PRPP-binding protein
MWPYIGISTDHLETLRRCSGYYECPKDKDGRRLGPLVAYAGKYKNLNGVYQQFVGDVYANFAMAEMYPIVLKHFADCLSVKIQNQIGLDAIDAVVGAPIGGYSLADAIGMLNGFGIIKAEKRVTVAASFLSREESELVFARHNIVPGFNYAIVEDVCNNFSTTSKLINLITSFGGNVVAILCFLNRSIDIDNKYLLSQGEGNEALEFPVVSLVRKPICEWQQDHPDVVKDVEAGNVVFKPKGKDEWSRLMKAIGNIP